MSAAKLTTTAPDSDDEPTQSVCKYCGATFHDNHEGKGFSSSVWLNRHIAATHHPVCDGCGCDNCKCGPPPSAEDAARWGGIVRESDNFTEYHNGILVAKRAVMVRKRTIGEGMTDDELANEVAQLLPTDEQQAERDAGVSVLGGMTVQQFEARFHALAVPIPEAMRGPPTAASGAAPAAPSASSSAAAPPQSRRWLEYYLSYASDIMKDEALCKELYSAHRDDQITGDQYEKLTAALKADFVNEKGCWVGPEFTIAVCTMLGTLDADTDVPEDWFVEAAIRDKICDMGFVHTPP